MREKPGVVGSWGHYTTIPPLGRVSNGTLKLRSDDIGLFYNLVPNPDAPLSKEVLVTVADQLVHEVGVGFASEVEERDDTGDLPRRLITQTWLMEISLVLWGAYGKATSAAVVRHGTSKTAAMTRKCEAAMRIRGTPLP